MPRTRRVPPDFFAAAIKEALEEYGDNVNENMGEIVEIVGKAGVKNLRAAARGAVGGRKYAGGWTARIETGRLSAQAIIYNARTPGLPHLLEFGHVTRNGSGRIFPDTPAHPHIKDVEEKLVQEFETKVIDKL